MDCMKRDMDLIRAILTYVENRDEEVLGGNIPYIEKEHLAEGFRTIGKMEWRVHCNLIIDHGLLKGRVERSGSLIVTAITWEGYDFLDNSRSPVVWNAAKQAAGHMSFGVFVSVLTKLATENGIEWLKTGYSNVAELVAALGGAS